MREELLPLFPLPLVLFPRTPLPLHIFEERYKEMIGLAIESNSEFGVVMSRNDGVVNTGCSALVTEVTNRYPDGRLDIVTRGQRRFELLELVDGENYLRGRVRFFDDDEFTPVRQELRQKAIDEYTQAREATGQQEEPPLELADPQISFQLAQILSDVDVRQQILMLRSETERLRQLVQYFPIHVTRFQHTELMREVAPRNGHGKHLPFNP